MLTLRISVLVSALFGLLGPVVSSAAPVSQERARSAALHWLAMKPYALGRTVSQFGSIRPCQDGQGQLAFYVAEFQPSGFLVLSADDDLEAVIAFSHEGHFGWETDNPLLGLVGRDLGDRRAELASGLPGLRSSVSLNRSKWERLAPAVPQVSAMNQLPPPDTVPDAAVDDLRVEPFVKTQWDQGYIKRSGGNLAVFNYYTPPGLPGDPWNYSAGCVATAIAQVLRFHQYPRAAVGSQSFYIYVNGVPRYERLLGGDMGGGAYVWEEMVPRPDQNITDAQCRAIGALLHDVGAICNMEYSWAGSSSLLRIDSLRSAYGYASAVHGVGFTRLEDYLLALRTNLDAGLPVMMAVRAYNSAHVVVADGYGYSLGTLYHHLNLGWGGIDDTWYNLPFINTPDGYRQYTVLSECVYNVDPLVAGEIASGRVTDYMGRPVAGVTLSAKGPSLVSARTNERGLFALKGLSPNSAYTLTHDGGAGVFGPSSVVVRPGFSADFTPVGNRLVEQFDALAGGVSTGITIEGQPASSIVEPGATVLLSISALGADLRYQWFRNGELLAGATAAELSVTLSSSLEGGAYHCVITGAKASVTSQTAKLEVAPSLVSNPQARLVNISSRTLVGTGDKVQTAGFVIDGTAPKQVLIRASGPALVPFGVTEAIPDPVLALHDQKTVLAENDNWDDVSLQSVAHGLGAFDWTKGSKDAALLVTLDPGPYSAVVQDKDGRSGVALVEVYEVDARARNVNISTRSLVGVGDKVQTAGFVISGSGLKTVLIRASGPALAQWLTGTLSDPVLEVRDEKGRLIDSNDDWNHDQVHTIAHGLGAFDWGRGSKDAALLLTLPAGQYNALVQDLNGQSGVGLIEVYEVNK